MFKILFTLLLPVSCIAQNVGIGITPTKARLEVSGAVGRTVAIFGGDGAGISLQMNPPAIGFNTYYTDYNRNMLAGGSWVKYLDMTTGSLVFGMLAQAPSPGVPQAQSTRRMILRQNGNVSINGPENNSTLFVGDIGINLAAAIFRGTQHKSEIAGSGPVGQFNYRNSTINAGKTGSIVYLNDKLGGNLLIGNGNGKVGINTVPTDVFEVKQTGGRGLALINSNFDYWEFFVEKNLTENASDFYVYHAGANLGNFYSGDGLYYHYSDRRVKTAIETMNNVLPRVMALRPCSYAINYNNPGRIRSIGLIAQEVQKLFPEITERITGDDLGYPGMTDLNTLNYDALGPIAIQAIREQQEKIKQLKQQVTDLKKRIAMVEAASGK